MKRACSLLVLLFALPAVALPQAITFSDVLAARRPSPEEIEAQLLLAEARRAAAGAASRAAQAPSVSALAGPRRSGDGSSEADVGIGVELPLLSGRGDRAQLAASIEQNAARLAAGSRALAAADLASLFVDVWLAQASAGVREEDVAAADTWLAAARRRVEAGADPPYEPTLVAGERDRSLVELVRLRRDLELAWGELAARADVGPTPRPVTLDDLPGAPAREPAPDGDAAAAIDARERLELGLARVSGSVARSRWGLQSEVAAEGEERLAHVGVAYRFPLRGERAAIEQEQTAAEAQARRKAEGARVALRARAAAARAALDASPPALGATDVSRALEALTVRLAEGKERPSEILPLRRQLLEARLAGLAARAARARAAAETYYLFGGLADAP
jgi:outer membrane protein TolC